MKQPMLSRTRDRHHEEPPTPAQRALRELVRTGGLLRRLSEPHFARFGVSPAQWGVLRSLARLEARGLAAPRMHELAEALLVHPPSLSVTLDRMERSGLIVRRKDRSDQRTRRVSLTRPGRDLLASAQRTHHDWAHGVLAGLSRRELALLTGLLAKAGRHMRAMANDGTFLAAANERHRRAS